jgi:hypothetical protein
MLHSRGRQKDIKEEFGFPSSADRLDSGLESPSPTVVRRAGDAMSFTDSNQPRSPGSSTGPGGFRTVKSIWEGVPF